MVGREHTIQKITSCDEADCQHSLPREDAPADGLILNTQYPPLQSLPGRCGVTIYPCEWRLAITASLRWVCFCRWRRQKLIKNDYVRLGSLAKAVQVANLNRQFKLRVSQGGCASSLLADRFPDSIGQSAPCLESLKFQHFHQVRS